MLNSQTQYPYTTYKYDLARLAVWWEIALVAFHEKQWATIGTRVEKLECSIRRMDSNTSELRYILVALLPW